MTHNPWTKRCWLLASPRSGSTYLQYLLNLNAGVPLQPHPEDREISRFSFGEHLNQNICGSWEEFVALDPVVSKIHCHQYGHHLIPKQEIKQQFEGIRFVLLERRNACAQAVSLALSNGTKIPHCSFREKLEDFRKTRVEIQDDQLLHQHAAVLRYQSFWRHWLHSEPRLVVTYESLIEHPRETIAMVLDFLQAPYGEIKLSVPLFKLKHPQTTGFVQRLKRLLEAEKPADTHAEQPQSEVTHS